MILNLNNDIIKKEREKERNYFNAYEANCSPWDRLFPHLVDVFGPFPMKPQHKRSKLINKPLAEYIIPRPSYQNIFITFLVVIKVLTF